MLCFVVLCLRCFAIIAMRFAIVVVVVVVLVAEVVVVVVVVQLMGEVLHNAIAVMFTVA